jgi:glycosyltransferase involved in cell wall biosynthesis
MRAELGLPSTAIVLGAFGSSPVLLMETVGFAVLQALRQEGLAAYLLLVGSGGDRTLALSPKSLQPWIKTTGFVDIARASHALQTIDLFLAAYPDGISARRTSAIAGMAHGLPLFSSSGRLSDRFWQTELPENIVPAESLAQLTPLVVRAARDLNFRSQLAEATAAVYERHFTWTGIVARMLGFLNTVVS